MKSKVFLFLAYWLVAADAAAQSPLMEDLARAREQWESLRLASYSFVISNTCTCPNPAHAGPLLMVVEDGRIQRALYLGDARAGYTPGQAVRKRTPLRVTVPGLFEFIEKKLRRGNAAFFKVKYDDKAGYPLRFEYDDPALKGEEIRIELKNIKRLE